MIASRTTPDAATSRSSSRSLSSSTASCSRSSTGALRCERPATKSAILAAVLSGQEQARAQREHEDRESDDGEIGGAPAVPAAGGPARQGRRVHAPRDVGREGQRIEREDAAPGRSRPENAEDQPGRQERKPDRESPVREPIERGERRKTVVEGAGPLGPELTLLQQVHHGAGEVQDERRDADERQP